MIRILVTGGGGQLAKCIRDIAVEYPALEIDYRTHAELDITDKQSVEKVFRSKAYNFCINCAAYTNVEEAENNREKVFCINTDGARNLSMICEEFGVTLIQISTDYVFDGQKTTPYETYDKKNPINVYGASKAAAEEVISETLDKYYIVRTSWLYSKYPPNFYTTILNKAARNEELRITDTQTGCPTNAINLGRFLLGLTLQEDYPYGIIHFTDNEPMTWYDFARRILEENKMLDKVKLVKDRNYRTFAARPANSVLKQS